MGIEDHLHVLQSRYIGGPQWLRSIVGKGYALLPRRFMHGAAYGRFLDEAELEDPDRIADLAQKKLAATLEFALHHLPAYRPYSAALSMLDDPLAVLARLPVTDKADIKRTPAAYQAADTASRGLRTFTGGSTAQPMEFFLERHVTRARETAYFDVFGRDLLARTRDDVTLGLHGRTVASAARDGGRLWLYEPIKRSLMFSSDHLERRFMPQYVEILRQRRPRQIRAYPSALLPLAQWLAETPCEEFSAGVTGILLTSENSYAPQIDLFRKVFPRARIVRHYGHSERVLMGVALDAAPQYRFFPLYGHLELVDAGGRPVETAGVPGEIVGTSFDNHAMPFVRYRTGDVGIWGDGGPGTVLQSIEGRLQEFVVCHDRRLVSVTTLGAAHFSELALADCIQYEQRQVGLVEIRVITPRPLRDGDVARIEGAVLAKTQGGCTARVTRVERIERTARGKHSMLIQHLDLHEFFGAGATFMAGPAAAEAAR